MTDMLPVMMWMIAEKMAQNEFAASKIATGLKLWELTDLEAQKARVTLYRKWRPKTDKKNMLPTYQAFDLAIAGIDPADVVERQTDMTTIIVDAPIDDSQVVNVDYEAHVVAMKVRSGK